MDWLARFRAATIRTRVRAAAIRGRPLDPALLECLNAGRPFCFLRSVDNVERVAMREAWEMSRRLSGETDHSSVKG